MERAASTRPPAIFAAPLGPYDASSNSYIAIFVAGDPTKEIDVSDASLNYYKSCVYDDNGNLFIEGYTVTDSEKFALAKLPRGRSNFKNYLISGYAGYPYIQWDGKYVTSFGTGGPYIYQLKISRSTATVIGTVKLDGKISRAQPWLQGNTFAESLQIGKFDKPKAVGIWRYPAGGKAFQHIPWKDFAHDRGLVAMTVSVAPNR